LIVGNWLNFGAHGIAVSILFSNRVIIDGISWTSGQLVLPASMSLKGGLAVKQNKGNKDGLLHGLVRQALGLPGGFSGW